MIKKLDPKTLNHESTDLHCERETVAQKNRQALCDLLDTYGVCLPQKHFDKWRPTQPTAGFINGLWHLGELMCVATDGILGLFVNSVDNAEQYHVTHFMWATDVMIEHPYRDALTGREKVFVEVRGDGAPPPLFSLPKQLRPKVAKRSAGTSRKTKEKSARQLALEAL